MQKEGRGAKTDRSKQEQTVEDLLSHVSSLAFTLKVMRTMQGVEAKTNMIICGCHRGRIGSELQICQDETKQLMESTYYSTWQTEVCDFPFPFFCSYINVILVTSQFWSSEIFLLVTCKNKYFIILKCSTKTCPATLPEGNPIHARCCL
jgi:hypothetical protein